jgi:hypothetical protein
VVGECDRDRSVTTLVLALLLSWPMMPVWRLTSANPAAATVGVDLSCRA